MKPTSTQKPVIVFLGTYPPRECGIATFTQDLLNGCKKTLENRAVFKVCAMNLSSLDAYEYPTDVEWQIDQNDIAQHAQIARKITNNGLIAGVVLQHEYGIFGGKYGKNILSFIENCHKPMVVTFHTVLPNPTNEMREITEKIVTRANSIVVLTENSRQILEETYPNSIGKVAVIPHGVHETQFADSTRYKKKLRLSGKTILTTFGLLSESKGIEYVIKSLPAVVKKHPRVKYLILGATHPIVVRNEGERYRKRLIKIVETLKLKKHVQFYDRYFSLSNLLFFLKATDVYISTSINPNQAVSGTLSYALGSGRAAVSTDFAQAREIINDENGKLIRIKRSKEFTKAILDLLKNKAKLKKMHRYAYNTTRHMLWHNVAKQYMELLSVHSPMIRTIEPVFPPLKLTHLRKMTDEFGLFQFAKFSIPDRSSGYTVDDNARALVFCNKLTKEGHKWGISKLLNTYLAYILNCQKPDGTFINYIDFLNKTPSKQNTKENLEEANARAIWALSETLSNTLLNESTRESAREAFLKALQSTSRLNHLRARALLIKALTIALPHIPSHIREIKKQISTQANYLLDCLPKAKHETWYWFNSLLSYNNGVLPESLFLAGQTLNKAKFTASAKKSLEFLIHETFKDDFYFPIGHSDWYKQGETRSEFDQQPEDPASMILALCTAYKITQNEEYKHLAYRCFTWFLGNNILGKPLYNYKTAGCFDGLHPDRVNLNQGAESLVSYLLARVSMFELA